MSDILTSDKCVFMGVEFLTKLTAARAAIQALHRISDCYESKRDAITLEMDLEAIKDIIRTSLVDKTMSGDDCQAEYNELMNDFLLVCEILLDEGDIKDES
tara:strand:+ start:267 stop:569 length:303 start_codon:yes stop_codon:yes gene_type:complete